jgi:hypothetical protein
VHRWEGAPRSAGWSARPLACARCAQLCVLFEHIADFQKPPFHPKWRAFRATCLAGRAAAEAGSIVAKWPSSQRCAAANLVHPEGRCQYHFPACLSKSELGTSPALWLARKRSKFFGCRLLQEFLRSDSARRRVKPKPVGAPRPASFKRTRRWTGGARSRCPRRQLVS